MAGPLILGVVVGVVGFILVIVRRNAKRTLMAAAHAKQTMTATSATAIASLLPTVTSASRQILAGWSHRVPSPAFTNIDQELTRTLPPAAAPMPPYLAAVFGQWQHLASTPFGVVPVFSIGPDGAVHAAIPTAPMSAPPA